MKIIKVSIVVSTWEQNQYECLCKCMKLISTRLQYYQEKSTSKDLISASNMFKAIS